MLREIAAEVVMHQKPKSRDWGESWQKVLDNLNPLSEFDVSQQSVSDRFNIQSKKQKIRMANEKCSTGGVEMSWVS